MVNARLGEKARLTYPRLQSVSRCLYTVFSGPYKAFSISILTVFPQTDRYKITPIFEKGLKFGIMHFLGQLIFPWK